MIVVFAFLIYMLFFYYRSIPEMALNIDHRSPEAKENKTQEKTSWLQTLLKKPQDYSYPATEVKIGVDFRAPNEKVAPTKLVVKHLDDYKFFCLNEVLKQEKIEFAYYQSQAQSPIGHSKKSAQLGKFADVIIYLPDNPKRNQIIEDLKHYEIQYEVQ
ncbi:hypothetical protein [Helicobacter sp. 11S02596-1]|uniref:hypothetical protein n=1 Tax=Helicobacter sp. 11S02596-1 TaxID=1476194 RepID=UPI000BA56F04|nr:hypothetical protein [Helicobacter sp. 11S02596-1]PAF44458.1 hypothetical protein BJI48_02725 [Helicobacter sp. 11S02596-1]